MTPGPVRAIGRCVALMLAAALLVATQQSAAQGSQPIVGKAGYAWPDNQRAYWPTGAWRTAAPENHGIDPERLAAVDEMARSDEHFRSLLIVKDGYLVVENYYHGGGRDADTDIWSATKAFTSALVGIALERGEIDSIDDRLTDYLPAYPAFGETRVRHALEQSTGLDWREEGEAFIAWLTAADWTAQALTSERVARPGERLNYSSANSHFLAKLLSEATGESPGDYAQQNLFRPLGITIEPAPASRRYVNWDDFLTPVPGAWKRDAEGIEIGAFGLSITAREMAKFGFLYLNKGRWNAQQIVPEAWVETSTRDYLKRSPNWAFGYQWVVTERAGQLTFNADGWGGQIICVVPGLDMVVVLKGNAASPQPHDYYAVLTAAIEAAVPD